jgi:MFS family permease
LITGRRFAPRQRPLGALFAGIAITRLGESMTLVALIWMVFEQTQSAEGVALVQFAYTILIPVGGIFVGAILDRYRVVPVMVVDAVLKAGVACLAILAAASGVGVVPAALVAALYLGLAWMVGGAGLPTVIAGAIPPGGHSRANLADSLAYSATAFIGPIVAGLLITTTGAIAALAAGAICSLLYAVLLWSVQSELISRLPPAATGAIGLDGVRRGFALVVHSPLLLSLTAMFMSLNAVATVYAVALPVFATQTLHGGAAGYTILLSIRSVGEMTGTILGRWTAPWIGVGRAIVLAVFGGGLLFLPLLFTTTVAGAGLALFVGGVVGTSQGPWVQTLRMRVIPPELRSRAFGTIRTMTNSLAPAAAIAAGVLVPVIGVPAIFAFVAAGWVATSFGLASVKELRESIA